ncbi:MAG: spore germination protein [Clostridia bacterium]|nr:spore germination protein [Clostridia bacterium]
MFGALILGEAAVSANIVSPVLVIIVAITGITAFAVPDYSLSFHIRLLRFGYILLAYFAGFLGVAFGFVFHLTILASINSFGISYLSPYSPVANPDNTGFFLSPIWKRENRRSFLNTKRQKKQENISLKWKNSKGV